MKLNELKKLLNETSDRSLRIQLSDGTVVPQYFHVTEVGQVTKNFIDCGGRTHVTATCLLQTWLGSDIDHRLSSGKLAKILKMSESVIPIDQIPLEVEYEQGVISQYPVTEAEVSNNEIVLRLGTKHTDCLAKESCGQPAEVETIPNKKVGCC